MGLAIEVVAVRRFREQVDRRARLQCWEGWRLGSREFPKVDEHFKFAIATRFDRQGDRRRWDRGWRGDLLTFGGLDCRRGGGGRDRRQRYQGVGDLVIVFGSALQRDAGIGGDRGADPAEPHLDFGLFVSDDTEEISVGDLGRNSLAVFGDDDDRRGAAEIFDRYGKLGAVRGQGDRGGVDRVASDQHPRVDLAQGNARFGRQDGVRALADPQARLVIDPASR